MSKQRNPDKTQLREKIIRLREQGMSYREVAREVGLHGTRVRQIVKSAD